MTFPSPGIHPGVPFSDYLSLRAIGSSFLTDMIQRCPAYARYRSTHPEAREIEYGAKSRGTALHAYLLERESFESKYVIAPSCERILVSGKRKNEACGAESGTFYVVAEEPGRTEFLCGTHAKGDASVATGCRQAIPTKGWESLKGMAAGVLAEADCLIGRACYSEVTLVWTDPVTGLLCKARPDFVCEGRIWDLKSRATRGAVNDAAWSRTIERECLHVQAAHYLSGAKVLGLPATEFGWIRVEAEAPYLAQVHEPLDDDSMKFARSAVADAMARAADCERAGKWPGYERTGYSRLPEWVFAGSDEIQVEEEEEVLS